MRQPWERTSERGGATTTAVGEATYVRRAAQQLWGDLPTLLGANLLCLALALPYLTLLGLGAYLASLLVAPFTVVPAFTGLLYCAGRIARGEAASALDALRGARRGYWRSAQLGLLTVAVLAASQFTYHLMNTAEGGGWLVVPWGVQLALLLFLGLLHVHALPLVALYDTGAGAALRNAFVLSFGHPWPTFGLISLALLLSYTLVLVGPGMVAVVPFVLAVFLANNTLLLVSARSRRERELGAGNA